MRANRGEPMRAWALIAILVAALAGLVAAKHLREGRNAQGGSDRRPADSAELVPGSELGTCLRSGRPTLAEFGAGWCESCKEMEPVLREAAARWAGRANVVFVSTDQFPELSHHYHIALIPTQIFFDSTGAEASRHTGYLPIGEIDRALAALGTSR